MDLALYAITVLVWGSSWLAIKFQLGVVAPEVSILYRFVIAAIVMLMICLMQRRAMRFTLADHACMALQGLCLFSTNYFFVYLGSQYLATGLVAVAFSTIVIMNIVGSSLLFRTPVARRVAAGAALGLVGITLVFWPQVSGFQLVQDGMKGLALSLIGTAFASAGMLMSAWNQKRRGLPVIQGNAYGMVYGVIFLTLLTVVRGSPFAFDPSVAYAASLLFLALFATVVGFWCYLTLIGRIGADRAAYATVLFPVIALGLSTLFEGYQWTMVAASGLILVLAGNALVLSKPRPAAVAAAGSQS